MAVFGYRVGIRRKGFRALIEKPGEFDAEKFIKLLPKEPFDYTLWQSTLWEEQSVKRLSEKAMQYKSKKK